MPSIGERPTDYALMGWIAIIGVIFGALLLVGVVTISVIDSVERRKKVNAYMHDCVSTETAARCMELWNWRDSK